MPDQEIEIEGIGTKLYYGSGTSLDSPGTWTEVDKLLELEPPEEEADDIQTTHMGTEGHTHTYQAGLTDPGEIPFVVHHTSAQYTTLRSLYRVLKPWRIQLRSGSSQYQMGYLKTRGLTVELEGLTGEQHTIKVSGPTLYINDSSESSESSES